MNKKVVCFVLGAVLFALSLPALAQQRARIPRVGFLSGSGQFSQIEAFRQGLRDLGYVDDKNIQVEYRSANGIRDRIPGFVAELVQLKVDVIILLDTSAILAAKQATKTIPIVMVATQDPVATGIVDSLAHPGGNITGLTSGPDSPES